MDYAPHRAILATPIGSIVIEGDEAALTAIRIDTTGASPIRPEVPADSPVGRGVTQLTEYFAGRRRAFDLPLVPLRSMRGAALRAAIAGLPYGTTASYGALARAHGSGARAMGGACARNPYPIVVPCHRVTSSGGAPERYSAGDGPSTKAWLIAHEARHTQGA